MHYYGSDEDEARFEAYLEDWERGVPCSSGLSYFMENPTDIGAKNLWLKYRKAGHRVPSLVMERFTQVIEDEIEVYQAGGRCSLPGELSIREQQIPIYDLLHCAKKNPEKFWKIVHPSAEGNCPLNLHPLWLLKKVRTQYPEKRKLSAKELYSYFGRLIGLENEEDKTSVDERMKSRYRTYKKNLENLEELFRR